MNKKEEFIQIVKEFIEENPNTTLEEWREMLTTATEIVLRKLIINNNKKSKIQFDKDQRTFNWATILASTKEEREQDQKVMRKFAQENPEMAQAMLESDLRTSL